MQANDTSELTGVSKTDQHNTLDSSTEVTEVTEESTGVAGNNNLTLDQRKNRKSRSMLR